MGWTRPVRDPQGRQWTVRASWIHVPVDALDKVEPGVKSSLWRLPLVDVLAWPFTGRLERTAPLTWVVEAAVDDEPSTKRMWVVGRSLKARNQQLDAIASAIEAGSIDEL